MDSTDALDLEHVPKRLLIVGGGIIGLEMATVYEALGSEITVVERSDQLIAAAFKFNNLISSVNFDLRIGDKPTIASNDLYTSRFC
jgi:pyruvate/2-oxoglutarate dehydrogenase complex dihydrolipoamide dehydrogenase (E3) component